MFKDIIKRLKKIDGKIIEIYAKGEYPVKARTKVQHVAHYQNDGTDKISPARFVEAAEERANGWSGFVEQAVKRIIDGAGIEQLKWVGKIIAKDINIAVNRIRTGRLRKSMRHRIK